MKKVKKKTLNKTLSTKSKETKNNIENLKTPHKIWHKFSRWMIKTFGKDLHGEWQYLEVTNSNGKKSKMKYRSFNDLELSKRLVGYEAMCKVEKFIKRCCPEIKIIRCDDSLYASSDILLIPHPNHGITVIFIPQCTNIQNQFFLYKNHHKELVKVLREMGKVYGKNNL
jgi:hypothetical protein